MVRMLITKQRDLQLKHIKPVPHLIMRTGLKGVYNICSIFPYIAKLVREEKSTNPRKKNGPVILISYIKNVIHQKSYTKNATGQENN